MSRSFVFSAGLIVGLGIHAVAVAQDVPRTDTQQAGQHEQKKVLNEHRVVKPGDRNCLRDTGSLIPVKPGECLPVAGRSYSGEELRRTGARDTATALRMLDPSIGH